MKLNELLLTKENIFINCRDLKEFKQVFEILKNYKPLNEIPEQIADIGRLPYFGINSVVDMFNIVKNKHYFGFIIKQNTRIIEGSGGKQESFPMYYYICDVIYTPIFVDAPIFIKLNSVNEVKPNIEFNKKRLKMIIAAIKTNLSQSELPQTKNRIIATKDELHIFISFGDESIERNIINLLKKNNVIIKRVTLFNGMDIEKSMPLGIEYGKLNFEEGKPIGKNKYYKITLIQPVHIHSDNILKYIGGSKIISQ